MVNKMFIGLYRELCFLFEIKVFGTKLDANSSIDYSKRVALNVDTALFEYRLKMGKISTDDQQRLAKLARNSLEKMDMVRDFPVSFGCQYLPVFRYA